MDYKLDGPTKTALDDATNNQPEIAYWRSEDEAVWVTNEAHLTFLNRLGIYTIDVANIVASLAKLEINQVDEPMTALEEAIGQEVTINDISNVQIADVQEGDQISVDSSGNIVNVPKPDFQWNRSSSLFATNGYGVDEDEDYDDDDDDDDDERENAAEWNEIESMALVTRNAELASYRITANMVASVQSNGRRFIFSIFCNSTEITQITQEFRFDQGNDQKSITIIEYLDNVPPGTKISVRAKRGSGNSTTLSVFRRTLSIEEIR